MNQELNNVTPARQMSGRRSKPSMDLLIDNQRVLSQYIVPKKHPRLNALKHHSDNISVSNHSEKSLPSLKVKSKPKSRRKKIVVISSEENISPKIVSKKRKMSSPSIDGSTDDCEDKTINRDFNTVISRSPYYSLKSKKIKFIDSALGADTENGTNKEDDLPLSKVFPDFKPRVTEHVVDLVKKRASIVLPPKKKIKFVSINELNGFQMFPKPISPATAVVPVVGDSNNNSNDGSSTISIIKSDILSLPKIPKKNKITKTATVVSITLANGGSGHCSDNSSPSNDITTRAEVDCKSPLVDVEVIESPPPVAVLPAIVSPRRCVRHTCTNVAIDDSRWDREFCSPDCAIIHTKNIFGEWLQQQTDLDLDMRL